MIEKVPDKNRKQEQAKRAPDNLDGQVRVSNYSGFFFVCSIL